MYLHYEDHLSPLLNISARLLPWLRLHTRDINNAGIIHNLSVDMIHGHVSHQKNKTHPWHIWPFDVGSNGVCDAAANSYRADTIPEIKESHKVEKRDATARSDSDRLREYARFKPYYE